VHARTEGWAAGLRLAAVSLAEDPNAERFVAEFSGSDGGIADSLLAQVLERQPEHVRRLLLGSSIVHRISVPAGDMLTGGSGAEQTLQSLEQEGAFVIATIQPEPGFATTPSSVSTEDAKPWNERASSGWFDV